MSQETPQERLARLRNKQLAAPAVSMPAAPPPPPAAPAAPPPVPVPAPQAAPVNPPEAPVYVQASGDDRIAEASLTFATMITDLQRTAATLGFELSITIK